MSVEVAASQAMLVTKTIVVQGVKKMAISMV